MPPDEVHKQSNESNERDCRPDRGQKPLADDRGRRVVADPNEDERERGDDVERVDGRDPRKTGFIPGIRDLRDEQRRDRLAASLSERRDVVQKDGAGVDEKRAPDCERDSEGFENGSEHEPPRPEPEKGEDERCGDERRIGGGQCVEDLTRTDDDEQADEKGDCSDKSDDQRPPRSSLHIPETGGGVLNVRG